MAVPKRKVTKSRGGKRRSHQAVRTKAAVLCPHCGSPKMPHRICANCGTYKGREILRTKEEA